ncbi:MAG: hypothetical protein QQN39_06125 [Nitrosopumilus sp.]
MLFFPNFIAQIIIPVVLVAVVGIVGYLIYHFVINDYLCNRTVNGTLREFNIKKTQFQIIKEYYAINGEEISEKDILRLQKRYRQHEPDRFLSMYDTIRDKSDPSKKN